MLPLPDLVTTRDIIQQLTDRLRDVYDAAVHTELTDPAVLGRALCDVMDAVHRRTHAGDDPPPDDLPEADDLPVAGEPPLGELCDHGIDLLNRLAETATALAMPEEAGRIQALTLPLACCVGRVGGELAHLEPVVDAVARVADGLHDPAELARLHGMLDEIADAVSPRIAEAPAGSEAATAWRALLINRAIVATRSQQPALMEVSFDAVIEHLPEEGPRFFTEGLGRLDASDYPEQVRRVMATYERRFRDSRRLH
jgi:hypothetical protein